MQEGDLRDGRDGRRIPAGFDPDSEPGNPRFPRGRPTDTPHLLRRSHHWRRPCA